MTVKVVRSLATNNLLNKVMVHLSKSREAEISALTIGNCINSSSIPFIPLPKLPRERRQTD